MSEQLATSLILRQFIPYRMVNLAKKISDSLSLMYGNEFGLTIPEWRILAHLAEHDRLSAKYIGEVTFMDKSKVSRAVKQLTTKGYLEKEKNEQDSRETFLSLTDLGQQLYRRVAPKALAWESELISVLDASEYRDLMRIMEKLDQQLELVGTI